MGTDLKYRCDVNILDYLNVTLGGTIDCNINIITSKTLETIHEEVMQIMQTQQKPTFEINEKAEQYYVDPIEEVMQFIYKHRKLEHIYEKARQHYVDQSEKIMPYDYGNIIEEIMLHREQWEYEQKQYSEQ